MRNAVFGGEEVHVEYFASVAAGEVSRFGDGVEDLAGGCSVDGEVIDGFVEFRTMGDIWRLWEHCSDRLSVGPGKPFILEASKN